MAEDGAPRRGVVAGNEGGVLTELGEGIGAHRSASSCRAPRRICRHPSVRGLCGIKVEQRWVEGRKKMSARAFKQSCTGDSKGRRLAPDTAPSGSHKRVLLQLDAGPVAEGAKRPRT